MRLDLQDEEYTQIQEPCKRTICSSLRRDTHWKCLLLTLLICGCLTAIAWCRLTTVDRVVVTSSGGGGHPFYSRVQKPSKASPCEDGYVYIPVAFVLMLYMVYLVECWHCHTRIQLQYKVDVNTVYDRVQSMRDALPIVWWKAVCYHYVRRTRQVTRYRNGDTFTTTQVYYERVNSHTASSAFNFTTCGVKDVSKTLVNLEKYPATKIKFSKGFSFCNPESEQEFEIQRQQFFQEHERRDDYMETREGLDFMNTTFKEHAIAFADPDNLPWYVSQIVFWVASLLLLSWPLRVLIEYKTAHVRFHVHKLFGCNYVDSSYTPGIISRVSTMASMELEMNIRNNFNMVPSYSEALLMDANQSQAESNNNGITPQNGYIPMHGANHFSSANVRKHGSQRSLVHYNTLPNPSTSSTVSQGAIPRRNVLLRLPSSVKRHMKRKRRRKGSSRPHSLVEVRPLMGNDTPDGSPNQPRRSFSMHTTLAYQTSRQNSTNLAGSTSEPQVVPDSSSSSEDSCATLQERVNQQPGTSSDINLLSSHTLQPKVRMMGAFSNGATQSTTRSAPKYSPRNNLNGTAPKQSPNTVSLLEHAHLCERHRELYARENSAFQPSPSNSPKHKATSQFCVKYSKNPQNGAESQSNTVSMMNQQPTCNHISENNEQNHRRRTILNRDSSVTPDSPPSYESALNMNIPESHLCVIQPMLNSNTSAVSSDIPPPSSSVQPTVNGCSSPRRLYSSPMHCYSESLRQNHTRRLPTHLPYSSLNINSTSPMRINSDIPRHMSRSCADAVPCLSSTGRNGVVNSPGHNVVLEAPGPDIIYGIRPVMRGNASESGYIQEQDSPVNVMETTL